MERILVLNCGSSSVKYTLFDMEHEQEIAGGSIERIGERKPLLIHRWNGECLQRKVVAADHTDALMQIRELLLDPERGGVRSAEEIAAVGHRVVHGGERFVESTPITEEVEVAIVGP